MYRTSLCHLILEKYQNRRIIKFKLVLIFVKQIQGLLIWPIMIFFLGTVYEESKKNVMIQPDGYRSPYTTLSYANGPGMDVATFWFFIL